MKKFVSLIAVLLSVVFISTQFLACGKKKREYDPNNFIDVGDPLYETGQIVKEKITLRIFAPKHSLHKDWGEMRLFKEMEKITNIHIEFINVNEANYTETASNSWDSKEPIDAYMFYNTLESQTYYAQSGMISEIGSLIDTYAPNYKKVMQANPEIEKITRLEDGNIYSFASVSNVPRDMTFKQFINKEWLDNVNSEIPTTLDEFTEVLKLFKNEDANGNGFNSDEIPLSSVNMYQTRNFLMSAFGYVSTGIEVNSTGNVVYVPTTDNYYEYLKYANMLYNEGLLDADVFTMTEDKDLARKGSQDLVGCFDGGAAYLIVGNTLDSNYTALPPLTSSFSSEKKWLGFENILADRFMIVKDSPYTKELVRWYDFLYSEYGSILASFGLEDEDWKWDNEDKTSWTFNVPDNMDIEEYRGTITPGVGLGPVSIWDKDFVLKDSTVQVQNINKAVDEAGYIDYLVIPYPQVVFTANESSRLSVIKVDLNNLVQTYEAKFIQAKSFTKAEFDAFVDRLETAGVNEFVKIHQDAYNRYIVK